MPDDTNRVRLYIMRHCRTRYNLQHRVQGRLDISLSQEGIDQAHELAKKLEGLGITRIVSSPLKRALESAQIYAELLGAPVETDARLQELDHGDFEGLVIPDFQGKVLEQWKAWRSDPSVFPIPGANESVVEGQARAVAAVREALARYAGETVLIVTHMHARAALLCALKGLALDQFAGQCSRDHGPLAVTDEELARIGA